MTAYQPLYICLLGYRSHPYVGGQGVYIKYLSKALVDAGLRVDVISGPPYPRLDSRVQLIKMPSLNLFEVKNPLTALRWHHLKSFSDFFEWFSMLTGGFAEPYTFGRRVAKYLHKHGKKYDLVHDNQSLSYGLLSLQKRGIPVVATLHHPITRDRALALNAAANWKLRLLVRRWHCFLNMQRKVVRKLKHVVTVSAQSQNDIASAFGRPVESIKLIYNGVDTEIFSPRRHIARKPFRIITTASADQPLKGLQFLLRAVAELRPKYSAIKLLVIGKLNPQGKTKQLVDELDLTEVVDFVSGISTHKMVDCYAEASIAVSPSLYEGFGLPAAEAMACAVPVVCSDGGALPEVVGNAGIITPAGNSQKLAQAIVELFDSPAKREHYAQAGRERILDKFCWRATAREFIDYYHCVINTRWDKTQPDYANHRF